MVRRNARKAIRQHERIRQAFENESNPTKKRVY